MLIILVALVLSLQTSVSSAQEVIDIPQEVVIVEEAGAQPEIPPDVVQDAITPPVGVATDGVIVIEDTPVTEDRDYKRLDIMAFQSLSYESTGEYTQVSKAEVVEGDVIGFDASMVDVVESTDEIHVYDAPCGKGWQLFVKETEYGYITSSSTGKTSYEPYTVVRSYGYGCEHDSRTQNW